jgi:hypothetical protein
VSNGLIKIADPYSELILDPNNDQYISPLTYPNIPPYPVAKTTGMVGVFQTAAPTFTFTATNYQRPAKENLMIYELLIRDFTYGRLLSSFCSTIVQTLFNLCSTNFQLMVNLCSTFVQPMFKQNNI